MFGVKCLIDRGRLTNSNTVPEFYYTYTDEDSHCLIIDLTVVLQVLFPLGYRLTKFTLSHVLIFNLLVCTCVHTLLGFFLSVQSSVYNTVPWLCNALSSIGSGYICNRWLSEGSSLTTVRKTMVVRMTYGLSVNTCTLTHL